MIVGYARVSTEDQSLEIQISKLRAAGAERIWSEKRSGSDMVTRLELTDILAFLREGDTLLVTRIDRLARSMVDLQNILADLRARKIELRATEQPIINPNTTEGELFIGLMGCFAQFETSIRRERQLEGIAAAKARGVYKGGKARFDFDEIQGMHSSGMRPCEIVKALGCSRATVYRAITDSAV